MNEEGQAPRPQEGQVSSDPGIGEFSTAAEISRRVGSILDAVEDEAQRLREDARVEAAEYLARARQRADELVAERQRRIAEISDDLIAKSEAVVSRLEDAGPVRQGFDNLVRALGDAAERLATETAPGMGGLGPTGYSGVSPGPPPPPTQPVPAPPEPAPTYPPPFESPPVDPAAAPAGFPPQPHPARAPSRPGWQNQGPPPPADPPGSGTWQDLDDARMEAIQMAATGATRAAVREHLHQGLGAADAGPILDEIFGPGTSEDARVPWTAGPR